MSYMPQEQINYNEREKREARTFEENNVTARSMTPCKVGSKRFTVNL